MNSFNKRVYEMLARILVFAATYPQFFGSGTVPGQLLAQIQAAVQALAGHSTSQTSGKGAVRRCGGTRSNARSALRSQIEAISRTAQGLKLPEFWMPRNRGDQSFLEVGKTFFAKAQPLKQAFIDAHLPADFLEQLDAAIHNLEQAISDQTRNSTTRTSATKAIDETRSNAVAALRGLDPIMKNLLGDDRPTLRAWQSCRHIERPGTAKAVPKEDPPPAVPPVTNTNAAAG